MRFLHDLASVSKRSQTHCLRWRASGRAGPCSSSQMGKDIAPGIMARTSIGSHYQNEPIGRVFGRYVGVAGYLDSTVTGSEVGGLARFIMTDSLAVLLLLDAEGAAYRLPA
jgi:hypothetical protein